jgi:hypothetical protein
MRSRQSAFSVIGECVAGLPDRGWVDTRARGERKQERLVGEHMLEHSDKKAGLARGVTDLPDFEPTRRKEPGQPFRLLAYEGKRLNCQHFCRFFDPP